MRWYVNDLSLQGQFADIRIFESVLREVLISRNRIQSLRLNLRTTLAFRDRKVSHESSVRDVIQRSRDIDFRRAVLSWLDRNGPFVEHDRLAEPEDYFEYADIDCTDTGLGEAARRVKAQEAVATFSFTGGAVRFDVSPLEVDHGIEGDRLGRYRVNNFWEVGQLVDSAFDASEPATAWRPLIEAARERFPRLSIPNSVYENSKLAREPFDAAIRDRVFSLLGHLDQYMADREPGGAEGIVARGIIRNYFTGDRALFTGESLSNQREFRQELSFEDPVDASRVIFAHWHGKISHRFFRMHFEWPVPRGETSLKILYLGPKITKS